VFPERDIPEALYRHLIWMQAWDLLESKKLFTARDEDGDLYDAAHLAQLMVNIESKKQKPTAVVSPYLLYCRSNIPCSSQKSAYAGLGPSGVKKAVYSP
jgi:hypothetical protein